MKIPSQIAPFPMARLRRLRMNEFSRHLVRENHLRSEQLIYPLFVTEGQQRRDAISTMPGIERFSIDELLIEVGHLLALGIQTIALFPHIAANKKTADAKEAYNEQGLMQQAIRALKADFPQVGLMVDVALDPFTSHGHDGLMNEQGDIVNDATLEVLTQQALSLSKAGADIIAPSDMMDGRIGKIRSALETAGFSNTIILAYAAKYASRYYGPFREAVGSQTSLGKSTKVSYQMDPANSLEALREAALDIQEGADIIMVKPAQPCLDIIWRIKETFGMPTFAYQVSGEYAMHQAAIEKGWLQPESILESLIGIKRAGADAIITYFAKQAAQLLQT